MKHVPEILELTRLGDPILREQMPHLSQTDIVSEPVKELIANIRYTNEKKQYGVGLAAPQVGVRLALSVIGIKPTPTRPDLDRFESVIINPAYDGVGRRVALWEGCQSIGSGDDILYGKALRYKKINATWFDENVVSHQEVLEGFVAHVFQHETDHLHGIVFLDRVRDKKSFMMADEYKKRSKQTAPHKTGKG